jgi:hypothetical protein
MNTKKLLPLLIVLLGLALLIAAIVVWLEPPEEGGVFSVAGGIISFLAGLGTSIKGWKDLLRKDEGEKSSTSQSQTQSQVVNVYNTPPSPQLSTPDSQIPIYQPPKPTGSTLPTQPYFFGREKELKIIAEALSPESRLGVR